MTGQSAIRIGIVGAAGRGGSFRRAIEESEGVTTQAVCDLDSDAVETAMERHDAQEGYTEYDELLWEAEIDAVILGTPQHLHVSQSIAALNQDLDVLCEVPAGVNVGECRDLVRACRASAGEYMMAENYVYRKPVQIVREMVAEGLFGDLYYAEGEYLHELKDLYERSKWRRTWAAGRNGNNYPTHSLGPVLTWMAGDRITRVACEGSGHHYTDASGNRYEKEDTTVFLAKTEADALITIRGDVFSERPHAMDNYQLQGTTGCYESGRAPGAADRVWLDADEDADDSTDYQWRDLDSFGEEFLPEQWQDLPDDVADLGHGGGDYVMIRDFIASLRSDASPPIGVHRAMDMTLPGLASMESIEKDGEWVEVPDSREW